VAKPVDVEPGVQDEIDEAVAYLDEQRDGLGGELVAAVRAALPLLGLAPQSFPPVADVPGVRSAPAGRFRFRLFFVEEEARVRVIAFARERRSRYWKKRLG